MKRLMLFLLAGSLLLLPVASYYAISLKDIREKYAQFIKTDAAQKFMPAGILALGLAAGGLYYYLTRKPEVSIRSLVASDYVWPALEQFQVYWQFNLNGGGVASCGYHTLLRGMQVVASKSVREDESILKNNLMRSDIITTYFGVNGTWRQAIMQRRDNDALQGDWLDDDEIEYLWNQYQYDIIPEGVNCTFFPIPNFSIVGTEFSELETYIKDNVRPFLNENINRKKLFCIFALGTMRHVYGQKTGTRGHWYPLVMYQNEVGKRKYYIMDSGSFGSINRLNDPNAWKVIDLIEQ